MKIIKALFVSIGLMTLAGSCTSEFDEMNVSPNDPTAISPQYLLPYALEASVDRYWGVRTRFERLNLDGAMCWMQYLTRNIYSNEGDNYEVSVGFYTNNWKGFFNDAQVNYQRIIALAGPGGKFENANYEGVALVMRSWVFSLLADVYGPIPYTEALKGTAESPNYTPVYDPVETVYAGLLKDLKTANEKLSVTGPAIAGDILYGGDILKWKKFANSLRLRLANRQAVKKSAESKAVMAEILGNATTYPVFTSNADNAKLTNSAVLPSNNEWHQVMIQDGRTDWNISKTLADRLNELGDSRITVYAQPNKAGKYEGHANGLPDAVATAYLGTSSLLGTYFTAPTAPAVIMTFSELNLILAEAAADGDITGSAQTYLEKGITASFDQYGLTVPAGYLAKVGTATKTTIMEQKWISLFGQAIEAWTEYRRTGLPVLPAKDSRSVFSNDGVLPTRLKYPTSEYSLNKVSLDKGISLLGGADDMKSKLWWVEK
ncbi:SusD/RagB family nutrient-binding outer membrane lipoprotein [Larkinella sp.]|uniref:SusD/RagB family nutrient-binding outer membrane lipoprotein n=1 Tax=Larkinella sp. TaxID=2034517 RepID=UPI003BACFD90